LLGFTVCLISIATMAQNDLRDREHDILDNRVFVSQNYMAFKRFVIVCWLSALTVSLLLIWQDYRLFLLTVVLAAIGLVYSECRQIPYLPNALVALAVSLPTLYPVLTGCQSPWPWLLFLATLFGVYGREILKDFDHKDIDWGYKWTLIQKFGENGAILLSIGCFILSTAFALSLLICLCKVWLIFMFIPLKPTLSLLMNNEPEAKVISEAKLMMDIGMAVFLLLLLFFS